MEEQKTETPTLATPKRDLGSKCLVVGVILLLVFLILLVCGIGALLLIKDTDFYKKLTTPSPVTTVGGGTEEQAPSGGSGIGLPGFFPTGEETTPPSQEPTCTAAPEIALFSATPSTIVSGSSSTLSWGVNNTADSISIDEGVGTVASAGTLSVTPSSTTTYTLTAKCGTYFSTKDVVVTVNPNIKVTSVTAQANPETYNGNCPKTVTFNGEIKTNGATSVQYTWEKNDGSTTGTQTLTFNDAGTKAVSTTATFNSSDHDFWARIKVTSPNALTSNKAETNVTCAVVGNFTGEWYTNFGTLNLSQTGSSMAGTYHSSFFNRDGSVEGTVVGNTVTGQWHRGSDSGALSWTLSGDAKTFNGTFNGTDKWCGAKKDQNFPNGCSFSGTFSGKIAGVPDCSVTLTRKNNSVSGTYCNGNVSGTVSYTGTTEETILTGNWTMDVWHLNGPLKFWLNSYAGNTFRGNYNTTNEWCGWRNGASAPVPCLRN